MPDRGADARLPGPGDAARARDRRRGPTSSTTTSRSCRGCTRSRGAARLPALGAGAAQRQGARRRRGDDEVGADGRARRDPRGDGRDLRPAARAPRPGADRRPVPAARASSTCRSSATGTPTSSRRSSAPPTSSASSTSRPDRSCAPPTTPTSTCRSRARASGRSPRLDPAARQHPPGAAAGRDDRADRAQRVAYLLAIRARRLDPRRPDGVDDRRATARSPTSSPTSRATASSRPAASRARRSAPASAAWSARAAPQPATWETAFTSMFLHANLLHIAGNMVFLGVFGGTLEDALGRVRFLVYYLLGGIAALALHGRGQPRLGRPDARRLRGDRRRARRLHPALPARADPDRRGR